MGCRDGNPSLFYMKWVSCWGTATSISDRREATFARDLTLRYPIPMPFEGTAVRLRFSNLTGTEPVTLSRITLRSVVSHSGYTLPESITIAPGEEMTTEEIPFAVSRGERLEVSFYLQDYTQLNAGTLVTGPLSGGHYCYGCYPDAETLPADLTRSTDWYYFLNTVDVLTPNDHAYAVVCYGDSITAQAWPDYLAQRCYHELPNAAIIRRAVCGTRVLRQYDCITYAAYGLKGETRFPIEMNVTGAAAVILQHGINDIIHPVGVDVNRFRPWSDMPTLEELKKGFETIYIRYAREKGLQVYSGTLLPIYGWRTYTPERDMLRHDFNMWLRTSPLFDGCVDFSKAIQDPKFPSAFAPGMDSGDHLHPSAAAYQRMADCAWAMLSDRELSGE